MSDFLISVWATMDPYELQAIHFHTLHAGISDAADELDRLRAENQRLREMLKMWLADEDGGMDCREYAKLVAVTREEMRGE